MAYKAGSAYVSISPDFRNFHRDIGAELSKEDATFLKAGDRWGRLAADAFRKRMDLGLKDLPTARIKADADTAKAKAELDETARTRTAKVKVDVDKSALSRLGSLFAGGPPGFSGVGGRFGGLLSGPALLAVVPAVEALLVELTGLASGFAAAGAGAGAFALLALPAFKSVSGAYQQVNKDQVAYDRALTATAKNNALAHLKADLAGLDPAQRSAVRGIQALADTYHKLAGAFEPQAFKIFNDGLRIANTLLPSVTPFANTFANVLDKLLGRADKFAQSKGFKDWLGQFHAIEGPALEAIGNGIGKIAVSAGKLLTVMSSKDVVNAINIAFGIIDAGLRFAAYSVQNLMKNWDELQSAFRTVRRWTSDAAQAFLEFAEIVINANRGLIDVVLTTFKAITHGAADAFGWVPGIGPKLKAADAALGGFRQSVDRNFDAAIGKVDSWKQALANAPKVAKIQGNIADLTAKLNSAKAQLKDPNLTKTRRAQIQANIAQLQKQIAQARYELAGIQNRTVFVDVYTRIHSSFAGLFAAGTRSAPPGWGIVGEAGPELIRLKGGETILPNAVTQRVMSRPLPGYAAGAGVPSGGLALRATYDGPQGGAIAAIVKDLRFFVQGTAGGNVQAALGRGGVR